MAFNIGNGVPALAGFAVTPGVESAVLRWDPVTYQVEIWRNSTNDFATATLVTTTNEATYTDTPLTPSTPVYHWARAVRVLSTGDKAYGTPSTGSSTPRGPEVGPASVQTLHIADDAVTARMALETVGTWTQRGKGFDGQPVPTEQWSSPLLTADFSGDGNLMIINVLVQRSESWPYFRGPGQTSCNILAEIVDMTTNPNDWEWIDSMELNVSGFQAEQMPIDPTQWIVTSYSRDYNHRFILPTVEGKTYTLLIDQTMHNSNADNMGYYDSGRISVVWEIFKR